MTASIERRYDYRVSRSGVYLGLLNGYVVSEFLYSQDINTAGTTMDIDLALTLDTASGPVEAIETEDGQIITSENEIPITTEGPAQLFGGKDSGKLVANGNDIEVWEYSDDHPNGVLVYAGYQSRMKAEVGDADMITVTVISYGKDLDDYIYGNITNVLKVSQTVTDSNYGIYSTERFGQSFITASGQTEITQIILSLARHTGGTGIATLRIWNSATDATIGGTPLASVSITISGAGTFADNTFVLSPALTVTGNTTYFMSIESDASAVFADVNTWLGVQTTGTAPYANGSMYGSNHGGTWTTIATQDFYFKIYGGSTLTDASFASYDPSQMIRDAIDGYTAQGGAVSYTGASIVNTGYSLDYDFITATPLEIIKKARELAPADWYWYVNPATGILTFKATSATATHKFILGNHILKFDWEATIEYIKNVVYFTGGPTAGVNLLKVYTDQLSLSLNKRGMEKMVDNRILAADEPSAAALADSFMDENDDEVFSAQPLTISAGKYDLSTINLGDTVSVIGLGSFIDTIIFQIASLERSSDYAALTLGKLPLRSDAYVDEIKRKLENQQTLDNPNTPS